jgi:uncharacterized membrane protein
MLSLIAVGFVMMTVGVALLCVGEVPIGRGKRIPALRSRLIGLILVGFLPLAWGVRRATVTLFESDAVEGLVVSWSICGVCWFAVLVMLFRVFVPKQDRSKVKSPVGEALSRNPFGEAVVEDAPGELPFTQAVEPPAPPPVANQPRPAIVKKSAAKKPGKPASQEGNPFDFS